MIDMQNFPDVPEARRAADVARIRATAAGGAPARQNRPRWATRGAFVGVTAAAVIGSGVATAAVLLQPERPTNNTGGFCYWEPTADAGRLAQGIGIGFAADNQGRTLDVVSNLKDICANEWRSGYYQIGLRGIQSHPSGTYQVPELVACVLPSGTAVVFPGSVSTCASLGLAPMG